MKPQRIPVVLRPREVQLARFVAKIRNDAGIAAKADNGKHGNDLDSLERHIQGCLGEMACAKGLDRYWFGAGTTWEDDQDLGVEQVRMTPHHDGRLIIRPDDVAKPTIDHPWVLVVQHDLVRYDLCGWIIGRHGVRKEYESTPNDRPPAYFVPQDVFNAFPVVWTPPPPDDGLIHLTAD